MKTRREVEIDIPHRS